MLATPGVYAAEVTHRRGLARWSAFRVGGLRTRPAAAGARSRGRDDRGGPPRRPRAEDQAALELLASQAALIGGEPPAAGPRRRASGARDRASATSGASCSRAGPARVWCCRPRRTRSAALPASSTRTWRRCWRRSCSGCACSSGSRRTGARRRCRRCTTRSRRCSPRFATSRASSARSCSTSSGCARPSRRWPRRPGNGAPSVPRRRDRAAGAARAGRDRGVPARGVRARLDRRRSAGRVDRGGGATGSTSASPCSGRRPPSCSRSAPGPSRWAARPRSSRLTARR